MMTRASARTTIVTLIGVVATLCLAPLASSQGNTPIDRDSALDRARSASQALGGALKSRLVATLSAEGPIAAVAVCNLEAPAITATISGQQGVTVGRTALKVRNPSNAPDEWETGVLDQFETMLSQGTPASELEVINAVTDPDGAVQWRYMAPIVTAAPCLVCHGSNLPDDLSAEIMARYPADQATGYSLGDLRGAFTVTVTGTAD